MNIVLEYFSIWRALSFFLLASTVVGWGKEGHYTTCSIAQGYLTEDALAAVKALLPGSAEGELANVCSWADEVRWHYHWSSSLHWVDTPDFFCNYNYCRDCHDTSGVNDRCVTGAINNYTMQLMTYVNSDSETNCKYEIPLTDILSSVTHLGFVTDNLTEALMFLSHFVGDIHQPLHVGFLGDEGGNTIIVHWYTRKANLHHIWDTEIIQSALKTFYNADLPTMIQSIQKNIIDDWAFEEWENCNKTVCPNPYASESISLACKFAYRNATPGTTLGDDYFLSRLPVVEMRLAQGGVRLAAILNRLFTSKASIASI
ncbi:hypothetical protein LIER_03886 [Lithospermum erythrorhizon]|uniref:Aspergillus nuclease S1 n=1 Tax=Lithospermum erythrorhizon TaxID=34254 RepID=A0AAV3NVH6_LITER